ncbi:MAG: hypothetical protein J1F11_05345 [Oscillospiraceae bacterium]|nr:hypothetical protein [Oscillospiraceae bacterium]
MAESNLFYCDYDVLSHYPSGALNSKYKTDLDGKLKEINKIEYSNSSITDSFKNGIYKSYITLDDLILYRVFGLLKNKESNTLKGARANGGFASTEFAESLIDAKQRLALDPSWMNTKVYEEKILLPKNSIISVGIVAPIKTKTGTILEGGADQILLPKDWSEEMVMGYRRVTSRQLLHKPYFSMRIKPDADMLRENENIYRPICPACGCDDVDILSDNDKFTIIGAKGGVYEMKHKCKNTECGYYW